MSTQHKPSHRNVAVVVGVLSRPLELRQLPDGSAVAELDVRVVSPGTPSTTVPVSWPVTVAPDLAEGSEIVVIGRVRRRFYRTGAATVSRTEVLADLVLPATGAKRTTAALAAAAEQVWA